jgi:hypothetical protein
MASVEAENLVKLMGWAVFTISLTAFVNVVKLHILLFGEDFEEGHSLNKNNRVTPSFLADHGSHLKDSRRCTFSR